MEDNGQTNFDKWTRLVTNLPSREQYWKELITKKVKKLSFCRLSATKSHSKKETKLDNEEITATPSVSLLSGKITIRSLHRTFSKLLSLFSGSSQHIQ